MLVKVKNKATQQEQVITQKAYNLAKKRYVLLGNAQEGSDLHNNNPVIEVKVSEQSLTETGTVPNQTTTAIVREKGAEVVVVDNVAPKPKGKPGRKPANQISSPAPAVEV